MLINALVVGSGGFVGAVLRSGLGAAVSRIWSTPGLNTLAVNLVGCLAIGLFAGFADARELFGHVRTFVTVGLLGGFTTFSAFGFDTVTLLRDGRGGVAAAGVIAQVIGGVALAWLGYTLTAPGA